MSLVEKPSLLPVYNPCSPGFPTGTTNPSEITGSKDRSLVPVGANRFRLPTGTKEMLGAVPVSLFFLFSPKSSGMYLPRSNTKSPNRVSCIYLNQTPNLQIKVTSQIIHITNINPKLLAHKSNTSQILKKLHTNLMHHRSIIHLRSMQ